MRSRPERKARQRRFFSELDQYEPRWTTLHTHGQFAEWLRQRSPVTRKTRLELMVRCSCENYDARTTAHFYGLFALHLTGVEEETIRVDGFPTKQLLDNRYEIIRYLGAGGQGVVILVYSHEVDEFFALKTFRPELASTLSVRQRFRREANIWIDVGPHPNIVQARFVDMLDARLCILMDYVAPDELGRVTLRDHISSRQLQLGEILMWSANLCDAMTAAYGRGLKAHRDLKPANILIASDGTARVTDFGIAGTLIPTLDNSDEIHSGNVKTRVGTALGTPAYMAPEQFLAASQCDEQSDIYSFGVILYEMISAGRWPYGDLPIWSEQDSADSIAQIHAAHRCSKTRSLAHPLFELARRCLQKQPEARIRSFAAIRTALTNAARRSVIQLDEISTCTDLDFWDKGRKATSLNRLGRHQEALVLYDEMLEVFGDELTIFNKARTLADLNRISEASDLYRRLLSGNSSHIQALTNLASLLIQEKKLADAEELLQMAISTDPENQEVRINLGNVSYHKGQFASAAAQYKLVLDREPTNPTGWYNLGLALLAQGNQEDAHASLLAFLDCADAEDSRIVWVKNKLQISSP